MQTGATEVAAMTTAECRVQEKEYQATYPVMYNILGKPTYVLGLKDKAGLVKMVAFVSVEDYSMIGLGETKQEAYKNYKEVLESEGNNIQIDKNEDLQTIEGTVSRISQDIKEGNATYYLTLSSNKELIFTATSKVSDELPLTMVGDKVVISYDKTDSKVISVSEFDNENLGIKKSDNKKEDESKKNLKKETNTTEDLE